MTDRISSSGSQASEAFRNATRQLADRRADLSGDASGLNETFRQRAEAMLGARADSAAGAAKPSGLVGAIQDGVGLVSEELAAAERLPEAMVTGEVSSPAEIAARIKRTDLTLKYSLEIRNRLVDAYREVMRMSV